MRCNCRLGTTSYAGAEVLHSDLKTYGIRYKDFGEKYNYCPDCGKKNGLIFSKLKREGA